MEQILTLTINPAIDISTSVERVQPSFKLRCSAQQRDPGGGGINVARVVRRLGGDVTAIYTCGGATGELLRRLVEDEQIGLGQVENGPRHVFAGVVDDIADAAV